jgi:transposase
MAVLTRAVFGQKSEKMPPPAEELRREKPVVDQVARQAKRAERAQSRAALPSREVEHRVPDEQRRCPKCKGTNLKPVGKGRQSIIYEYVPGYFERQVHVQETLACSCHEGLVVAEGPTRVAERSGYGPAFISHLITAKCADSLPLHRVEKSFAREGVPIARSTMVDLFHTGADELRPLYKRLLNKVRTSPVVQADETPLKVMAPKKTATGYLWTFLAEEEQTWDNLIAYCFSPSRAGVTPAEVLGGTRGMLVVDAYTGYNRVLTPEGRQRAGCWAHVRRKAFDALPTAPIAKELLQLILELYRIEAFAKESGIVRSEAHLKLRKEKGAPALRAIRAWLNAQVPLHPPKSPLGKAIRYALSQWLALTRFLDDPRLPIDNNKSERALRVAALGRKNFLWVGHHKAGENLAALYSLVATCEANGLNPRTYLTDVLIRIQSHPSDDLDSLLPATWARRFTADTS